MINQLKMYIERIDNIEDKENLFKFYSELVEKFQPIDIMHKYPEYPYQYEENKNLKSKIERIKSLKSLNYNECDDDEKFEYFVEIYEIYLMSYLKTYRRDYLSVLGKLNEIKEEKKYIIDSKYEKQIIGNC